MAVVRCRRILSRHSLDNLATASQNHSLRHIALPRPVTTCKTITSQPSSPRGIENSRDLQRLCPSVHLFGLGGHGSGMSCSNVQSLHQFSSSMYKRSIHTACSGHLQLLSSRRGHFTSLEDARKFVASLPVPQRICLEKVIVETMDERSEEDKVTPPTWNQLRLLCLQHMLPFIGFGFLDNFIMITVSRQFINDLAAFRPPLNRDYFQFVVAGRHREYMEKTKDGEYIDVTVGAVLSISTMAAAGIGNLISDLAGLGLADQVEALCKSLGIPNPKMTMAQLQHRSARLMGLLGRFLGIIVGCTIGMVPLLWFDDHHKQDSNQENQ